MNYKKNLLEKIENKSAIVGVIGMGYVGLPLTITFANNGFNVIGFDIDEKKIPLLNEGKSYIKHIDSKLIKEILKKKKFQATSDFARLKECDAIIICVPTPLDEHREPDLRFVKDTALTIQKYLQKGQLITLESTTYPGTTEEVLLPLFESAPQIQNTNPQSLNTNPQYLNTNPQSLIPNPYTPGKDFFLAFSPEREDPGNKDFTTSTIPKIIGGVTENCTEVAVALYNKIIKTTVPVSSPRVAEAAKLLENIYRSVNIALVNELKVVFERMNIDIWEVIEAAKTKPFGFQAFYPGPGLGGHCIPIDPFYLTWKAREYEVNTKFIELAGEVNTFQPYYVVERAIEVLNQAHKAMKGSKILILGVAYKKNVDDMRESPSLKLIELLRERGAEVDYNDPYVPKLPPTRKYNFDMNSVELTKDVIRLYDLVLLATDHDDYDYDFIRKHARLILDTRNAFKAKGISEGNVFKA
ncbi:nucleotide sugar dehydrogenase [Melioribacter sp. OK-6-Me]|uniref:nucleotide sugar dehydrogenase n=1 Tax=unclassified Melioribacter TaxID=2627329 RepID=UPI003ED93369